MQFEPFFTKFPKIAAIQTRAIRMLDDKQVLPEGEYGFITAYCNDKKCDCRRAMIHVYRSDQHADSYPIAVLSYGWEPKSFYLKWSPGMPKEELEWFKGPAVEPFQPQSQYAGATLYIFKEMLKDANYAKRFIRQYVLFKWKSGMKLPKDLLPWLRLLDDCPCGSGEKLKFCCAAK